MLITVDKAAKRFYVSTNFPSNTSLPIEKASQHFVVGNWSSLLEPVNTNSLKKVVVYEDFSSLIQWINLLGKENVAFFHSDPNFIKVVEKQGIKCYTKDVNMIPKNLHGVGNPAFSITEQVLLNHPESKSLCMVMPAKYMLAPNFKAQGWSKTKEIKEKLEKIGLKEVYHIPNGFFKQMQSNGKEKAAQVQTVLVITEPGYNGQVKVTNLHTSEVFYLDRGIPYVKTSTILPQLELYGQGNNLQWNVDNYNDISAEKWAIGVPTQNPNATGKGEDGNHLEGTKLYAPGDTIKKNICYSYFDHQEDANKMFNHFTSEKVATAFQKTNVQPTFSSVVMKMLKI